MLDALSYSPCKIKTLRTIVWDQHRTTSHILKFCSRKEKGGNMQKAMMAHGQVHTL
jgi:hypothetical protein